MGGLVAGRVGLCGALRAGVPPQTRRERMGGPTWLSARREEPPVSHPTRLGSGVGVGGRAGGGIYKLAENARGGSRELTKGPASQKSCEKPRVPDERRHQAAVPLLQTSRPPRRHPPTLLQAASAGASTRPGPRWAGTGALQATNGKGRVRAALRQTRRRADPAQARRRAAPRASAGARL